MKKSLFALVLMAAAAACAVAVTTVRDTVAFACGRAVRAWDWIVDVAAGAFASVGRTVVRNLPGPLVALIAAKLYQLRQIKRERPVTSPTWRMCPSG